MFSFSPQGTGSNIKYMVWVQQTLFFKAGFSRGFPSLPTQNKKASTLEMAIVSFCGFCGFMLAAQICSEQLRCFAILPQRVLSVTQNNKVTEWAISSLRDWQYLSEPYQIGQKHSIQNGTSYNNMNNHDSFSKWCCLGSQPIC